MLESEQQDLHTHTRKAVVSMQKLHYDVCHVALHRCNQRHNERSALPETSETVSFSHDTTLTYSSTEAGIMHLKTAVFPRMTL